MRPSFRLVLAGLGLATALPAPHALAGAQELPPPVRRANEALLARCEHPAARVDWDEKVVYMGLAPLQRDTARPVAQMYRLLILEELTGRLRAPFMAGWRPPAQKGPKGATVRLPPADGRYGPHMLGAQIRFLLRGNGSIDRVRPAITDVGASAAGRAPDPSAVAFAEDVRRELLAMAAAGSITAVPDFEPDDSVEMRLWVWDVAPGDTPLTLDAAAAAWPLFDLSVPRMKPAAPAGGAAPGFPEIPRLRGVNGTIVMEYVVDQDGRVDTASIRDLRKPGDVPAQHERDYQAFVASVRKALPRMTYLPAEAMGCRVKQRVSQPFAFDSSR